MVDVSSALRSKDRTDPSAPAEANTFDDAGDHATSKTSLSWALYACLQSVLNSHNSRTVPNMAYMSCVTAAFVDMSQTVHVVSIELVTMYDGLTVDQSNEVKGAARSFIGFCRKVSARRVVYHASNVTCSHL